MGELMRFVNDFEHMLLQGLPGKSAQMLMMPKLEDPSRFTHISKQNARQGAVMIMFYEKGSNIYIPLIKRPDYNGTHANQVSFPGGKHDPEDNDLYHTATRENYEEIGIAGDKINIIGKLSEHYITASNFNVLPVVSYHNSQPNFKPDNFEVASLLEVNLCDLIDDTKIKEKEIIVKGGFKLRAPYYELNGEVVWGATAMMLAELRQILKKIKF